MIYISEDIILHKISLVSFYIWTFFLAYIVFVVQSTVIFIIIRFACIMLEISNLSLRCINYNNRRIAASHDGLILETSTDSKKERALWTVVYSSSRWILVNRVTSMRLTFYMTSKLISSSEEEGSISNESVVIKDGNYRLLLRLSPITSAAANDKLALELLAENDPTGKASTIFFVCEGTNQTFRDICPDFISSGPTSTKTIADIVDNDYGYVVIGSSFCSLAVIHRILQKDAKAKFLVLEKGSKYLPEHHQQCPSSSFPREVEYRPWSISHETIQNEFVENVCGQIPFLGGRSTYWSGWSPTPSSKELAGWPEDLKTSLQDTYFGLANEFLGVITANNINAQQNDNYLYDTFQSCLKECLESANNIESVEQVFHAPLAMGNERFIKFSTPEMLLSMKNVTVIFDCTVEKILYDGKKATALQTNQGTIILPPKNSKLVLAMSTLPATTLVLNSFKSTKFPQLSNVGKRFTAHFVSSIIARVPRQNLLVTASNIPEVELGAVYISGMQGQVQYHLQLSGVAYTQCKDDINIYETCKKYSANSIPRECIDVSQDFIVVSCSTLGELDHKNKRNQFNLANNGQCLTTNGELAIHLNDQDKQLWNLMDNVTFDVMKTLSPSANKDDLQYWHENDKTWKKDVPSLEQIRTKRLVHDASTMWIGNNGDMEAPVSLDYRLRGVDNVYITGGTLWPTGGSWNPVVTIVAMAMHLADTIGKESTQISDHIKSR